MEVKFVQTFQDCVFDVLCHVLGEVGLKAILLNMEFGHYIDDPGEFHRGLHSILGSGALVLERAIVKELFSRLNLPCEERSDFDFAEYVATARNLFTTREKNSQELTSTNSQSFDSQCRPIR